MPVETHPIFLKRLDESRPAVLAVSIWLAKWNYHIVIPRMRKAPTHDQWQQYADNGDLFANGKRCEVKHESKDWDNANNFPFKNMIVFAKHAFDNANPKIHYIYKVNKDMTRVAQIDCKNFNSWWTEEILDKKYGYTQTCYMCNLDKVMFYDLDYSIITKI